jgi:heavy metal sensor kinase
LNPGSIRFRLAAWCAGLSAVVMLAFGGYTYKRLDSYITEVSSSALRHRGEQIARTLLTDVPKTGEEYVRQQIYARYNPAANEKFVRITRGDGSILYLSDQPMDRSFEPDEVPPSPSRVTSTSSRIVYTTGGAEMLIVSTPFESGNLRYVVDVGVSTNPSRRVLHTLVVTLAAGLPAMLVLAVFGGYVLVSRALAPVNHIMRAAQDITLHHLGRRLPVPDTRDEIASLSQVLNQMIARLDESFQHTSRFTTDASHELRTPLTIIKGELEALLYRREMEQSLRDDLSRVLEEVERLVKIVEGLFSLSRLDSGEGQAERVRLDLAELAETTAEQMCLLAEDKRIAIHYDTKGPVPVNGDRARLKQVIVNLLDNAIKYTPSGGEVSIAVSTRDGSAMLDVSDTGRGVSEEAIPHLFERFYRADDARSRRIDGAGLGLSIVQSICAAHGGTATLRNRQPHGCQVVVQLPSAR